MNVSLSVNGVSMSALPGHQIKELVDKKGGREIADSSPGYGDELPADGAPELTRVPGEGGHYPVEAVQAHGVGAGHKLGNVFTPIVHA